MESYNREREIIRKHFMRTSAEIHKKLTSINYEELLTLLCDCEAVINSRPLTYSSDDEKYLTPLSPSMFIGDIINSDIPELDEIDRTSLIKRHKYIQDLRDGLRTRFRKEYFAELVNSGQRKPRRLVIGEIVLIGEEKII